MVTFSTLRINMKGDKCDHVKRGPINPHFLLFLNIILGPKNNAFCFRGMAMILKDKRARAHLRCASSDFGRL